MTEQAQATADGSTMNIGEVASVVESLTQRHFRHLPFCSFPQTEVTMNTPQ